MITFTFDTRVVIRSLISEVASAFEGWGAHVLQERKEIYMIMGQTLEKNRGADQNSSEYGSIANDNFQM